MNYAQPGGLNERKQALIKALKSGRGGAGGAARLNQATPFGAIPRLGFRPDARSVFHRPENFNFGNSSQGQQQSFDAVSGPGMGVPPGQSMAPPPPGLPMTPPPPQPQQLADTGGFGPSASEGAGGGVPQNTPQAPQVVPQVVPQAPQIVPQSAPSSQGFSGGSAEGSSYHMLDRNAGGGQVPPPQGVPAQVQQAFGEDGVMSGGVAAWLRANPWYMEQLMSGGGGYSGGGGTVL